MAYGTHCHADDSALRECDESRGTRYSERHSAQIDANRIMVVCPGHSDRLGGYPGQSSVTGVKSPGTHARAAPFSAHRYGQSSGHCQHDVI